MSGRKNNLVTYVSLAAGDMSTSLTSASTDIRWLDNVVMYLTFTGTPTGTFKVQVSPDNITFVDLALVPVPTAAGAAGSHRIGLNQLPDPYVRAAYTAASGTGTLTVKIAGKMI